MSNSINVAFVRQFEDNLNMLAQQKGSKILPHVNVMRTKSKIHYFERLGSGEASEIFDFHGDTPEPNNLEHSRRGALLRSFDAAEMIDRTADVRMLINPENQYALSLVYGLGRKADDVILGALYGSANSYDSSEASSTVALGSGQIIDEDYITANSDLTVDKLREARRILLANDVDLDAETPILLLDAQAEMSLLDSTEVTSSDYNTVKALVNGQVDTFMGFKFVRCQRLANAMHKTSESFVRAIVFVPSALGVVQGDAITTKISERADKRYSNQIYAYMDIGAVRVEESKVVSIECYRA
jgi:hypothetical protein